jgi:ElaB/YqjD/DUF883 family membrane-anchored ribosome-binding protein
MGAMDCFKTQEHKLAAQMREVLAAAEEFIHGAGQESGDKLAEARRKFEAVTRRARDEFDDAEDVLIAKSKAAAASTDAYVKAHPWTSAGIGAAMGLLIGMLINNRR